MRLLHTSDWHLGRSFHREGMLTHQGDQVDHLVQVVRSEQVDAVLVSGDIYDRALPPVDAIALADEALARLAATGARVVLTSGNHDSAIRLGAHASLIDRSGVHLRTDPDLVGTPLVLEDRHGPVALHPLPYLDPAALAVRWQLRARSHQAVVDHAMRAVRRDLSARPGTRSVLMAHLFVAGGRPSDSERDITVGGISRVAASTFDGLDYVALGHLHGQQSVSDRVRYSGSPLAYSFSERTQTKGAWLVDLDGDGTVRTAFVDSPVPRGLAVLRGRLDDLLADPGHEPVTSHWLQVTLTDPVRPAAAMERLRRRFPHTLVLDFEPEVDLVDLADLTSPGSRSERELASDFFRHVRGVQATTAEQRVLDEAFGACCSADPVGP